MSFAVDAIILLYAANASSPANARAVAFLEECTARGELMCLPWPTVMAFLRIGTHPSIFPEPLTCAQAEDYITALLELPHVRTISELEGFWSVYQEVSGDVLPRGNLVPDAHLAAILKQNGIIRLFTNDADFRRFSFLEVHYPLSEADR